MSDPVTPTCPLCDTNRLWSAEARALQACDECAESLGITPMAPSTRPLLPCARCGHAILVRAVPRDLTVRPGKYNQQRNVPMSATYRVTTHRQLLGGRAVENLDASAGVGLLELFICRACGFVEWYCRDPGDLPIGPHYMTEVVDTGARSPYR